jgi:hypothetical protein
MNLNLRRKYFNLLGFVVVVIQIIRYSFDALGDWKIELGVFSLATMMALNIKGLGAIISNKFTNSTNNNDNAD